jgi:hypothetical protein
MAKKPHLERLKIARATLTKPLWVILGLVGAIAAWMMLVVPLAVRFALPGSPFLGSGGVLALVIATIVYLNLPGRVTLGRDGMVVDRRDGGRYISFADVDTIQTYAEDALGKVFIGVELTLRGGEVFKLPVGQDHFGASERRALLMKRLKVALASYRRLEAPEHPPLLERGERSTQAWLHRLREVGGGANAHYREAPVEAERLWRIVEAPAAAPTARAGAAAALAPALDPEGKKRLRIAATGIAEPRLRIALECAARDDEPALLEALDELESSQNGAVKG